MTNHYEILKRSKWPSVQHPALVIEWPALVILPYISGVSKEIRYVSGQCNFRVIFKTGETLHIILTRVKDRFAKENVPWLSTESPVIICRKVYTGETAGDQAGVQRGFRKVDTKTSGVVEYSWNTQHAIQWSETTIFDQTRRTKVLKVMEVLHTS